LFKGADTVIPFHFKRVEEIDKVIKLEAFAIEDSFVDFLSVALC